MVISRNDMPIFASHAGFSVNHGAVQRWTLDTSYRAEIRDALYGTI